MGRVFKNFVCLTYYFSNTFFEEFYNTDLIDLAYKVKDAITNGIKTNSLMVVGFKNKVSKYNISKTHAYTLIDYTADILKLYNPHGRDIIIPTETFLNNFRTFHVSCIGNKVFNILKRKTFVEYSDTWNVSDKKISYV